MKFRWDATEAIFFFNIAKLFILQPENKATYLAASMTLCKLLPQLAKMKVIETIWQLHILTVDL